jgi:hypothetical protein
MVPALWMLALWTLFSLQNHCCEYNQGYISAKIYNHVNMPADLKWRYAKEKYLSVFIEMPFKSNTYSDSAALVILLETGTFLEEDFTVERAAGMLDSK